MSGLSPWRLLEIKALGDAASAGPWRSEPGYNNAGCPTGFFYIPGHNGNAKVEMLAEDAAFTAESRSVVPELLDEVDALRARRDELLATINRLSRDTPYDGEAEEAKQRVATLVAEVGTLRSNARSMKMDAMAHADRRMAEVDEALNSALGAEAIEYPSRVQAILALSTARDAALALIDEDKNPEYAAFWRTADQRWVEWARAIVGTGPDELTMWGDDGLREQVAERLKASEEALVKLRAATQEVVVVAEDFGHLCRGECGELQEAAHDLKAHHGECVVGVARAAMGEP